MRRMNYNKGTMILRIVASLNKSNRTIFDQIY